MMMMMMIIIIIINGKLWRRKSFYCSLANSHYISLDTQRKTTKYLSWNGKCFSRDSKQRPFKVKSQALSMFQSI